jgi:hypothetical protein
MERVEAFHNIKEMTPEVLLELTQSHKLQTMKGTFKHDIGLHRSLLVTEEEIVAMGETLKGVVFFVSPHIMRSTMELARSKSVLIETPRWL